MSSTTINVNSSCNYANHLFNDPLCKKLHIINRVANIAFHIFTLCIPLAIYHITSYCHSKITHYSARTISHVPAQQHLKLGALDKYKQKKLQYADDLQPSVDSLFELQPTITLSKRTLKLEVGMDDEGRVEQVSSSPVFLYTDYLGPCVAAIGRCKMSDSSMLIGVTHLYPEGENFDANLTSQISTILKVNKINLKHLNKENIIQDRQFKQQKLSSLIDKFVSHPSYKDEEIELFFSGGNGDLFDVFWRELTAEYAKSIPQVNVIGTYFNPYHASQEIQKKIRSKDLLLSLMAGITNHGSILLHKSHAIDFNFQTSKFDSLFSEA